METFKQPSLDDLVLSNCRPDEIVDQLLKTAGVLFFRDLLDPRNEGPMKYFLFVCPFVRSFLWNCVKKFFNFLHEVRLPSNLKSGGAGFFFCWKIGPGIFYPKGHILDQNELCQVL